MVLAVCDAVIATGFVVYIVWFVTNALTRYKHEDTSGMDSRLAQAYFLKKDFCKGTLLFKGWHHVLQSGAVIFPLIVLFDMAYANSVAGLDPTIRIVMYTALSLLFSVADVSLRFDSISSLFRDAYCCVNDAIMQFEAAGDDDYSILHKGMSEAEGKVRLINLF